MLFAAPCGDLRHKMKNGIGLGRAYCISKCFQTESPPLNLFRHTGNILRLFQPEDTSVHPFGKPISHSTQSGFNAALSDSAPSWKMICADRFPFFLLGS